MDAAKLYQVVSKEGATIYFHFVAALSDEDAEQKYVETYPDREVTSVRELSDTNGIMLQDSFHDYGG